MVLRTLHMAFESDFAFPSIFNFYFFSKVLIFFQVEEFKKKKCFILIYIPLCNTQSHLKIDVRSLKPTHSETWA